MYHAADDIVTQGNLPPPRHGSATVDTRRRPSRDGSTEASRRRWMGGSQRRWRPAVTSRLDWKPVSGRAAPAPPLGRCVHVKRDEAHEVWDSCQHQRTETTGRLAVGALPWGEARVCGSHCWVARLQGRRPHKSRYESRPHKNERHRESRPWCNQVTVGPLHRRLSGQTPEPGGASDPSIVVAISATGRSSPLCPPSEGPQLRASEATRSPLPPTTPETRHLSHRHRAVPAVVERRAKKQPIPRRPKGWTRGTTTSPKPRRADNPPSAVRGRPSVAWGPLAGSALVGPRPDTLLAPLHLLPRSPGGLVTLLGKAGTLSLLADRSATGPGPLP
jgi:hypothetical protein